MNYRRLLLILVLVTLCSSLYSQEITRIYPETLKIPGDTFQVKFSNSPYISTLNISNRDTVDMGTDGGVDMVATIYYGDDSVKIRYDNLPYFEIYFIPVRSPSHTAVYRLHFNRVAAGFSASYMAAHRGKVTYEVPEVFELANIIWTLSPSGRRADNLYKKGDYYDKVITYFKPYMDHPIFKKLDFPDSLYLDKYLDFRENSLVYSFRGNDIVSQGPYYYVRGNDRWTFNSLFRQLLPLVKEFAAVSGFREFYSANKAFYTKQIEREKELMPVKDMWTWLEQQFPGRKYQSYKVVFSPLIGGTHSTQQFGTYSNSKLFREAVMFVSGPDREDTRTGIGEERKQGLTSGIVFTEIDHNYVNPVSYRYTATIDSIFSKRSEWTSPGGDEVNYPTPEAVFNEYMTHAVFCLWVLDRYDAPTAQYIIKLRELLMVDQRHFKRFADFNDELIKLKRENPTENVKDLFQGILAWCRAQD